MGVQTSMRIGGRWPAWWCCWPPAGPRAASRRRRRPRRPRPRPAATSGAADAEHERAARPRLAGAGVALRPLRRPTVRPGPAPWRRLWAAPSRWPSTPRSRGRFAPATPDGGAERPDRPAGRSRRGVWTAVGVDPAALTMSVSADGRTVTGTRAARRRAVAAAVRRHRRRQRPGRWRASGHLAAPTAPVTSPASAPPPPSACWRAASGRRRPRRAAAVAAPRPDAGRAAAVDRSRPREPTVVDRLLRPRRPAVAETYVPTPAPDGGAWLLPAYRFTFDDGVDAVRCWP